MDPPVSVPKEAEAMQAATAAADPPLEPPGVLCVSQGLSVGPKWALLVVAPYANSLRFVLPIRIAPAERSRRTTVASSVGTKSLRILDPAVVGVPAVRMLSFNAIGIPCSGP